MLTNDDFDTLHDIELGKSEIAADIADGATISVELQWAEAVGSVNKDYVIELSDRGSRVMRAHTGYINNLIIQRPVDYLVWENDTGREVLAALRIHQVRGTPFVRPLLRLTGLKHKGEVTIHFPGMYRAATVSPRGWGRAGNGSIIRPYRPASSTSPWRSRPVRQTVSRSWPTRTSNPPRTASRSNASSSPLSSSGT